MNIKNYFVEDLNLYNKSTLRSLVVPVAIFAIFFLLIPFRIDERVDSHILYFSKRIFAGIILFSFFLRSEELFLDIDQKKDLDKITTILTWIVFIPTVLTVGATSVVILLIFSTVFKRLVYVIMIILSSVILFILGAKPKFVNSFPKVGQCILISNHCSTVDELFLPLIFWFRKWKVIFAFEVVRIPLVKFFAKTFVGIPVNRQDQNSKFIAALKIQRVINSGFDMMFYPEGRRLQVSSHENGKIMEEFVEDGAFELAIKNQLPIVPVITSWTFLFKPRSGQWWLSPRTIKIIYLDPIYPLKLSRAEIKDKDKLQLAVDELKTKARNLMVSKLEEAL